MMKRLSLFLLIVTVVACAAESAMAATVWMPFSFEANVYYTIPLGDTFAIFDDSDQTYTGNYLVLDDNNNRFDTIYFMQNGGDWNLKRDPAGDVLLTLTGSDHFILGMDSGDKGEEPAWVGDTNKFEGSPGQYLILFDNEPLSQANALPVPITSSVFLFGSGFLGLFVTRRRKKGKTF